MDSCALHSRRTDLLAAGGICLIALAALLAACGSDSTAPPPGPPPDATGPAIEVVFPLDTTTNPDMDGDGLVDIRLRWSDAQGTVDPATATLVSRLAMNGAAQAGDDLLGFWTVDSLDADGLLVHETLDSMLRFGDALLVVSVSDDAGNAATDTIRFRTPAAALHKTIDSGLIETGFDIVVCPDDHRVYMSAVKKIVVADADSLKLIGVFRNDLALILNKILCIPGDPILWVTGIVDRFDRVAMQWLPRVTGSFLSRGIVQSRSDPNLLYVGEDQSATIGIIDRAQSLRLGHTGLPFSPFFDEIVSDVTVLAGDRKIYSTRSVEGGVLVSDTTGTALDTIDLSLVSSGLGSAINFALSADDRHLYAAVSTAIPLAVVDIDTQTDSIVRSFQFSAQRPIDVALSPSGRRMFITTQGVDAFTGTDGSPNFLADIPTWRVIQQIPRPKQAGVIRFDQAAAFHPSGRLIFVIHDSDIDVYIHRE